MRFQQRPLYLCRALLIGGAFGLIPSLTLLGIHSLSPGNVLRDNIFSKTPVLFALMSVYFAGRIWLASIAVQALCAIVAVLLVRRLSILHAILAAFIAGVFLGIGEILLLLKDGTSTPAVKLIHLVLEPTVVGGVIAASLCAPIATILVAGVRAVAAMAARRPGYLRAGG